jgi:DNA-binding NarL/FixJ family response regulator
LSKPLTVTLVVAKPNHLWDGLRALLRTVPQIEIIAEIRDPAILLKMGVEIQPDLVLLDASLFGEEILTAITKIRGEWAKTKCVVLMEDSQHRQAAYSAGADYVLIKGFPAAGLVAIIEELLPQGENDSQIWPDT